jgi:hypothetical protein
MQGYPYSLVTSAGLEVLREKQRASGFGVYLTAYLIFCGFHSNRSVTNLLNICYKPNLMGNFERHFEK